MLTHQRSIASVTVVAVLAVVASAAECWVSASSGSCCKGFDQKCPPNAQPGQQAWFCQQESDSAGCTVGSVTTAGSGASGRTGRSTVTQCDCVMTKRTCGSSVGECIPQSPVYIECTSTTIDPSSPACTGASS